MQHYVGVDAAWTAIRSSAIRPRPAPGCPRSRLGICSRSLAAWPFAWPLPAASIVEWSTIVYLGVCQIGLAYVFLTAAIRVLPALEVSLLLLIEPVLNPIWTWMIRGERPGAYTIIGGAIIVVATAIKSVYNARVTVATEVTKTG